MPGQKYSDRAPVAFCDRRTTAEPLAAEENRSLVPALARYRLETVQSLLKGNVLDFGALNRDHHAPLLFVHHIDGAHTQTGCQHAVVAGGCAAALNVAQNSVAGFDTGAFLNLLGEVFTDTAQAGGDRPFPCPYWLELRQSLRE